MHSISEAVIWHNKHLDKSFYLRNLKEMWISELDDLKYLFTSSILNNIFQFKYLQIENCKLMEVVLIAEENGQSALKFPSLTTLNLYDLPNVTMI